MEKSPVKGPISEPVRMFSNQQKDVRENKRNLAQDFNVHRTLHRIGLKTSTSKVLSKSKQRLVARPLLIIRIPGSSGMQKGTEELRDEIGIWDNGTLAVRHIVVYHILSQKQADNGLFLTSKRLIFWSIV